MAREMDATDSRCCIKNATGSTRTTSGRARSPPREVAKDLCCAIGLLLRTCDAGNHEECAQAAVLSGGKEEDVAEAFAARCKDAKVTACAFVK